MQTEVHVMAMRRTQERELAAIMKDNAADRALRTGAMPRRRTPHNLASRFARIADALAPTRGTPPHQRPYAEAAA
jgi:hypothetical protein